MPEISKTVRESIERLVASEGYELVHVELKPAAGRPIFRIYIDRTGGVNLDDCQKISQQVSTMLDVEDPVSGAYTLEVSSPGLDRGLYKESDYQRFAGRKIRLVLREPHLGQRKYRVSLIGIESGLVRILDPVRGELEFPIQSIEKANLEIEI
jgi:ribosome maturation factor RimP